MLRLLARRGSELLRALVAGVEPDDLQRSASALLGQVQLQGRETLLVGVDSHSRQAANSQSSSHEVVVQHRRRRLHLSQVEPGQERTELVCDVLPRDVLRNGLLLLLSTGIGHVQQRHVARCCVVDLTGVTRERLQPGVQIYHLDVSDTHGRKEMRDRAAVQRVHTDRRLSLLKDLLRFLVAVRRAECIAPQTRRRALERTDVVVEDHERLSLVSHSAATVAVHHIWTVHRDRSHGEGVDDVITDFIATTIASCLVVRPKEAGSQQEREQGDRSHQAFAPGCCAHLPSFGADGCGISSLGYRTPGARQPATYAVCTAGGRAVLNDSDDTGGTAPVQVVLDVGADESTREEADDRGEDAQSDPHQGLAEAVLVDAVENVSADLVRDEREQEGEHPRDPAPVTGVGTGEHGQLLVGPVGVGEVVHQRSGLGLRGGCHGSGNRLGREDRGGCHGLVVRVAVEDVHQLAGLFLDVVQFLVELGQVVLGLLTHTAASDFQRLECLVPLGLGLSTLLLVLLRELVDSSCALLDGLHFCDGRLDERAVVGEVLGGHVLSSPSQKRGSGNLAICRAVNSVLL